MKILLIGEYSRLHLTLAEGLRELGHEVLVASDGDGHKDFPRDVDLTRKSSGVVDTLTALNKVRRAFKTFKGYDVVQIINPCFLTLGVGANRYFFNQLRKNNEKVFLGAFGDDSYWVKACSENKIFKYSEFFVDGKSTELQYNKMLEEKWLNTSREKLNHHIANNVDGIVACLYEYYKSYEPNHGEKLKYIPLPIHVQDIPFNRIEEVPTRIKFFLGIDKVRSEYKGTDLMEEVLTKFAKEHADVVEFAKVESVSYEEYQALMLDSHVVLDQLYSHSPSVNPLQAMAQGKIVISGGENEMYNLMGDVTNRPIVNVYPSKDGIWNALKYILENKENLPIWSQQGRQFVEQYHDAKIVAEQYLEFWKNSSKK